MYRNTRYINEPLSTLFSTTRDNTQTSSPNRRQEKRSTSKFFPMNTKQCFRNKFKHVRKEIQELPNVSESSDDVLLNKPGKLQGRVEIYGQPNVGKETFISHILSETSDGSTDDLGYLTVCIKDVSLSLKNMEQSIIIKSNDRLDKSSFSVLPDPDVCLVMFSLLNKSSFQYAKRKVQDLKRSHTENVTIILVGNKSDVIQERRVSSKEACHVARFHGCQYLETSLINCKNAKQVLSELAVSVQLRKKKGKTILRNIQKGIFKCFLPLFPERLLSKRS